MREPKNQMLGTMEPPPLMQLSVKAFDFTHTNSGYTTCSFSLRNTKSLLFCVKYSTCSPLQSCQLVPVIESMGKKSRKPNYLYLRGYCTSGPYFWRFCAFSQKIKQPRTKYPMDLVRNVPRNSKITILLQCRPLLWSYSEKCAKINIFHVLSHKSITTWVSETPVQ